jgi:HSP20 family protein
VYRRFRVPSIWRDVDQLRTEMNRLFDASMDPRIQNFTRFPAVNIWTNEDAIIVTAELPGMDAEDIDINVSADSLVLSGERAPDDMGEELKYHRDERRFNQFSRTIQLPFIVDPNKVNAKLKDGILEVSLSRAEADKPKKIAVKIAS